MNSFVKTKFFQVKWKQQLLHLKQIKLSKQLNSKISCINTRVNSSVNFLFAFRLTSNIFTKKQNSLELLFKFLIGRFNPVEKQ